MKICWDRDDNKQGGYFVEWQKDNKIVFGSWMAGSPDDTQHINIPAWVILAIAEEIKSKK